jgi:Cft2 family RNA processing exonuclease
VFECSVPGFPPDFSSCENVRVQVEFTDKGIHLPEIGLWLDPAAEPREAAWISHAHSDHARGLHGSIFATAETLDFYRLRWPADPGVPQSLCPVAFRQPWDWRGARLTAYPASHIAGAAQLLIEYGDERIVYTGDIKLQPPLCGETTQVVHCDRLIIESTFGLPIYHFLDREAARERIVGCAREALSEGLSPVFIGYPLGRGQEIVHTLSNASIPTAVHGSIARLIPGYERAGYSFGPWENYAPNATDGKALVVTPSFRNYLEASGKRVRIAYVSGWAALHNARARSGAEELIPYSDHAGFDELLAIVEASGAKQVDVVHGYTDAFAHILCSRGIDATSRRVVPPETAEVEG